uniref:Uncharacterized protein n=1 Tax=Oryza sativa subsp. japonica TaxID=39947 RepID=Q6EPK6_ORYSJ|nr:hypothetical protein [Oryza sativa Japonica Group]BAD29414.1 hypothetical protein [Oryza sativa Japonica Group]
MPRPTATTALYAAAVAWPPLPPDLAEDRPLPAGAVVRGVGRGERGEGKGRRGEEEMPPSPGDLSHLPLHLPKLRRCLRGDSKIEPVSPNLARHLAAWTVREVRGGRGGGILLREGVLGVGSSGGGGGAVVAMAKETEFYDCGGTDPSCYCGGRRRKLMAVTGEGVRKVGPEAAEGAVHLRD